MTATIQADGRCSTVRHPLPRANGVRRRRGIDTRDGLVSISVRSLGVRAPVKRRVLS
jgi:hypothetical protein